MKYLVTANRNNVETSSTTEWLTLLQATREYFLTHSKGGAIEGLYVFLDARGGIAIFNAESHDQAQDLIISHPQFPYYDWEIEPVLDGLQAYDKFIGLYAKQVD
jgi:muconolactone delta-isomerase